ncbi:hypothetical protein J113_10375 [Mycobacterium tuberculosis CAS/NITR204]|uniref:NfeD-like C-terminal domain-containing protein n=1 Tax=Mycobacterium tuberculosis CAS/NITR204 TaxID=1310114 RepID=R4M837_MYCTX|nr:hypothetical protein J113_10375 [Mycobacterium tuberculosis CAS/NITR204]
MPVALIWLIAALVLVGAEALTGDMFLLMLGGGALAASVSSWLLAWPMWADGAVFLLARCCCWCCRPAVRRAIETLMGIEAPERKKAVVLGRVARDGGQVKLDGQVWTARPLNDGDVFEPGDSVTVVQIDGATAVVFKDV